MKERVCCVFVAVAVAVFVFAPTAPTLTVSWAELGSLSGGADSCYMDGFKPCHNSVLCPECEVIGDCPQTIGKARTQVNYREAKIAATGGKKGVNNLPPVACIEQYSCLPCQNIGGGILACLDAVAGTPDVFRGESVIDPNSDYCDAGLALKETSPAPSSRLASILRRNGLKI